MGYSPFPFQSNFPERREEAEENVAVEIVESCNLERRMRMRRMRRRRNKLRYSINFDR